MRKKQFFALMGKGFLSFVVGAVILLSIVSSGALLSGIREDAAFQKYRFLQLQDIAVKRAIYSSVSEAASDAFAISIASQTDSYAAVMQAVRLRLLEFDSSAASQGYSIVLWCGSPSEEAKQRASEDMLLQKAALAPAGALPIAAGGCVSPHPIDIPGRKIHFSNVGFSAYFDSFGTGFASQLPSGFEVDF